MGFAKIDHRILTDPKTATLSLADLGAFVGAIVFCSREETDGRFDFVSLQSALRQRALRRSLARLQDVGLLQSDGRQYVIVNFAKYQTPREAIEAKRAANRERKRKERGRRHAVTHTNVTGPENREQRPENRDQRGEGSVTRRDAGDAHIRALDKAFTPTPPRATLWPDDFEPTPEQRRWALEAKLDLETERRDFGAHAKSQGRVSCDWHADFDRWLLRSVKWRREREQDKPDRRVLDDEVRGSVEDLPEVPFQ